jgi:hypothetical protein
MRVPYASWLVPIVSKVPMVPNVLNGWNIFNPIRLRLTFLFAVCDAFSSRMNNPSQFPLLRAFPSQKLVDELGRRARVLETSDEIFLAVLPPGHGQNIIFRDIDPHRV